MKKQVLSIFMTVIGLLGANAVNAQFTPLYFGYYYNDVIDVIDTTGGMYTVDATITLTSDVTSVDGCYGLSLNPSTNEMYILYQDMSATDRRLGILDPTTGEIEDIGVLGNFTDIAFRNDRLYAIQGSYSGHQFHEVNIADASTTSLLTPSNDNECSAICTNFYTDQMLFVDEDHFTEIDLVTNTEIVDGSFIGFDDETNALCMKNSEIALVSNYNDLYEFNVNTLAITYITNFPDNIHAMAFGQYPLIVAANGPTTFCSTAPSPLFLNETGTDYQWYLDGAVIPGATDETYLPAVSGTYTCELDGELTKNELEITVIESPVASYTATPNPVFLSLDPTGTVNFVNTSTGGADSYSWDFDNGFTTTAENPSFAFALAGTYNVMLAVNNSSTGCSDTTYTNVVVAAEVGIASMDDSFKIYPIPSNDFVTIEFLNGNTESYKAYLIGMNGQIIAEMPVSAKSNNQFDISTVERGNYFIKIQNENSESIFQIVKQ